MQFLLALYITTKIRRKEKSKDNIGNPDRKVQFLPAVYIKTETRRKEKRMKIRG